MRFYALSLASLAISGTANALAIPSATSSENVIAKRTSLTDLISLLSSLPDPGALLRSLPSTDEIATGAGNIAISTLAELFTRDAALELSKRSPQSIDDILNLLESLVGSGDLDSLLAGLIPDDTGDSSTTPTVPNNSTSSSVPEVPDSISDVPGRSHIHGAASLSHAHAHAHAHEKRQFRFFTSRPSFGGFGSVGTSFRRPGRFGFNRFGGLGGSSSSAASSAGGASSAASSSAGGSRFLTGSRLGGLFNLFREF